MSFSVENYYKGLQTGDDIFSYKGDISSDIINFILDSVEKKIGDSEDPSKTRKKVYNVLVESLQNLYHHADAVPTGFEPQGAHRFGLIIIKRDKIGYLITAANFIGQHKVRSLEDKIVRINNSSEEEIKELYKFILHHQKISDKGGGGLGLVDIARKTGNKLLYQFYDFDESHSFFSLSVKVDFTKAE